MQLSLAPFSSRPPPVDWLICAISKCPLALGSEGLNAAAAVPPVNCQVGNHSAVLSLSAVLTQSLIFASCPLPFLLLCLGIHHQYQHFFPQPSCLLASWWNGNTYCSREAPPLFHYASSWEDECQFPPEDLGPQCGRVFHFAVVTVHWVPSLWLHAWMLTQFQPSKANEDQWVHGLSTSYSLSPTQHPSPLFKA